MKAKKIVKITALALAGLLTTVALAAVGYVVYVLLQYYRIEDNYRLSVSAELDDEVTVDREYKLVTYNLGFAAYSPKYTFFMDTGVMDDGTKVKGKHSHGLSKADVKKNINGQIELSKSLNADFYFLQEADTDSDRIYHINMVKEITSRFDGYAYTYGENFHTAKLLYPLNEPIGKTKSGIITFSKYKVDEAVRRSFPITKAFPDKFFDLDRCFTVHRLPVEGKDNELVLINLHMSAYDEGGKIRTRQLNMLNEVIAAERQNGNYVVAGGDFNHCLIADEFENDEKALNYFECRQKVPDWVKGSILHNDELAEGFSIAAAKNCATCRGADIPYTPGVNYSTVIDGFVISDNVELKEIVNIDTQYVYSDHNPVSLTFKLKG